jgi:Domain of unknown function (DUF4440)
VNPSGALVTTLATLGMIFAGLGTGPPPHTAVQEVEVRVRQCSEAWARSDVAALDRFLADDYVDTDAAGRRRHRAEWLRHAREPRNVAVSFARLDVEIHGAYAEVSGADRLTAPGGETALRIHQRWVRRGGDWLRTASEAEPIALGK